MIMGFSVGGRTAQSQHSVACTFCRNSGCRRSEDFNFYITGDTICGFKCVSYWRLWVSAGDSLEDRKLIRTKANGSWYQNFLPLMQLPVSFRQPGSCCSKEMNGASMETHSDVVFAKRSANRRLLAAKPRVNGLNTECGLNAGVFD
jgi:hypothetical protein